MSTYMYNSNRAYLSNISSWIYLLAADRMYLKNAEYTLVSYFLSFEPSSEKWGFSSCVTACNVRQVVLGFRWCTNIGIMLPTYVDDKKETVLSVFDISTMY